MNALGYDMNSPILSPVASHDQFSHSVQNQFVASQAPEQYDTDMTFDLDFQTHFLDEEFTADFLDSTSISSIANYVLAEDTNDSSIANTTSMGPPARSRKRKAPTLRAEAWEPYKTRIVELHITQDLPLKEVKQKIEDEFGFSAEIRQYRTRISQWGLDKNVKPNEMKIIVNKRQKRKLIESEKADLAFTVRGNPVPPENIDRWMKRNNVLESFLYSPSAAASTPSAIDYRTISNRSTPVPSPAFSLALPILSPRGISSVPQSPRIPSPAPSISSIIQSQGNFVGQSPAPIYRSISSFSLDPFTSAGAFQEQSGLAEIPTSYRYLQADEERVRDQLSRAEASLGMSNPETLDALSRLCEILLNQGRLRSAERMVRDLVQFRRRTVGDKHAATLQALDSLGDVLHRQGSYSEAEKLYRWILEARKPSLGTEHYDTLTSFGRLGHVLGFQHRLNESEMMLRTAVEGFMKTLGPEHLSTLSCKDNLASTLAVQGCLKEAKELYEQVIDIRMRVLGEEHQGTLMSMSLLASVYAKQGLLEKAESLEEQSLRSRTRALGKEHPDTLASMHDLAYILGLQGRIGEALPVMRSCVELKNKVLGPDHPETRRSLKYLYEWGPMIS